MPLIYFILGLFLGLAGTYVGQDKDLEEIPTHQIILGIIATLTGMGLIFFSFYEASKSFRDNNCAEAQVQRRHLG
ncbi:MAG: hypothetical protein ACRC62_19020 [Microcoleus sp.]